VGIKELEKDMDEFKNDQEGKTEELKVKTFPLFRPKLVAFNGFPFAGQHTDANSSTAEAGRDREDSTEMQMATLELGSYKCNCLWVASVAKRVYIEQIEAETALAHKALANASSGIDKMRKELKSLADKVVKIEVRDTSRPDPWYKILTTR